MRIGKFDIDLIDTGIFGLDGGSIFGIVPKPIWAKAYHPGDDQNRIPLAARPLLVRWNDKVLMIDTGNGNKMNEKLSKIYNIDNNKSNLDYGLKPYGIGPSDVDFVILTHLHFDHCGGATKYINNEIFPTFPNAKYYVQKEQLEWALNPNIKEKGSYSENDFVPLMNHKVLETIDGNGELFPGIELINCYGHTKAMQMVKITDENKTLVYVTDLIVTTAHIKLPFLLSFDNFPLTSMEEKRALLENAYNNNWILCYEHDAFVQSSTISRNEKGYTIGDTLEINSLF